MADDPKDRPTTLIVGQFDRMPILGKTKAFHTMDETTVCTVETRDRSGAIRGAVAFGISRHDLQIGFATYSSIAEAEALIALIQLAIEDAKRIEAGIEPLAPDGSTPPSHH